MIVTVAYVADRAVLKPLIISCFALLYHASQDDILDLHIVYEGFTKRDRDRVHRALHRASRPFQLTWHEADLSPYVALRPFHGSRMNYVKLHLPYLIESKYILYIDADTLPLLDPGELVSGGTAGHILAACSWDVTADNAQQREWFAAEGLRPETPILNSGVMLIDRAKWLDRGMTEACLSVGHRCTTHAGDQVLINTVLRGDFMPLRTRYNIRAGANVDVSGYSGILHFVGSVKPWEFWGHWTHKNYPIWRKWATLGGERATTFSIRGAMPRILSRFR